MDLDPELRDFCGLLFDWSDEDTECNSMRSKLKARSFHEMSDCPIKTSNKRPKTYNKKSNETAEVLEWKHRRYIETHMPKLVKNDIRKSYITMLFNVMNSSDIPLYCDYLSTYCTKGIISQHALHSCCPTMPKMVQFTGIANAAQHWYNEVQAIPDVVLRMVEAKLHVFSNTSSSKIVSYFEMSATRVFDLPYEAVLPASAVITRGNNDISVKTEEELYGVLGCSKQEPLVCGKRGLVLSTHIKSLLERARLLSEPIPMNFLVRMVLHLDANHCIERMDIESVDADSLTVTK